MKNKLKKYKSGSELKTVPSDAKGLAKLPTEVRNKMGYMKMGGITLSEKNGGERKLLSKMAMGGTFDLSDEFVEKMKKGGDMVRTSYKYGGGMTKQKYKMGGYMEPKKMQIGGSMQSRMSAKKVGKKK